MNILYVCHRIPYPPNKGEKIRSFYPIRHLAGRHDLHLYCLADHRKDLEHVPFLRTLCRTVDTVYRNPLMGRIRSLAALWSSRPLTLHYFHSSALARKIREAAARTRFDVAVAYSSGMIPYLWNLGIPMAIDFVDLDSQKWLLYAEKALPPMKWVFSLEGRRLFDYELKSSARAEASILVTEEEGRLLAEKGSPKRLEAVSMGVDLDYYRLDIPPDPVLAAGKRPILIFVGNMDYRPNVDAVLHFANQILPQVTARIPEALFLVVGANPAPIVRALHNGESIIVTGAVPDPRPYLKAATLAVVPLNMARGIQTKVLEAMAMEVPVVLSLAASRGVDAQSGQDYLIAEDGEGMAQAVVSLVNSPEDARSMGKRGRIFVKEHFAWPDKLLRYETILKEIARNSSSRKI